MLSCSKTVPGNAFWKAGHLSVTIFAILFVVYKKVCSFQN